MNSRMERHYELEDSNNSKRTLRNQQLYKTIYEDMEYTNVEGITSIGRTNDINISQIKDLLKSRDEYKKERENDIRLDNHLIDIQDDFEEKNYDIKDILSRAKNERTAVDDKKRSLDNEKYNILKKIDTSKQNTYKSIKDIEAEEKELKELLQTLTNTAMLKNIDDKALSIDLFDDLKGKTNTVATSTSIKSVINKAKEDYQKEDEDTDKLEIDRSFYTNSSGLKSRDFEDLQEVSKAMRKNNVLIVIVLIILFAILLFLGIYFGMKAF